MKVIAAHAFSKKYPGARFVNPQEWASQNLFNAVSIWDIPLRKPRYTCTLDRDLLATRALDETDVAKVLKRSFDAFAAGGICKDGVIQVE